MHDEFAQLLVQGVVQGLAPEQMLTLPSEGGVQAQARAGDTQEQMMRKTYRRKLQLFLLNSDKYQPARVLKLLPAQLLQEVALVRGRL
eukprot:CAMPEP_0173250918 /NCGR_PEP_ID=MMETSP1142-20121109/19852_1 /TAXON_ID=483371 /ORGANISM="non described non described, Strain CCMP2298" /LENGTH=87 /DNA_ID=CAMNT_0014183731 /DNA_START=75 /DNA_END=334 /DNA_ORIENTATION=-